MLTLKLKLTPPVPLNAQGWLPEACPTSTAAAEWALGLGNQKVAAGEWFDISGNGAERRWRLEGDLASVHHLGEGMAAGEVAVMGDIGRHCGARMSGGKISIAGDAGDHLGAAMHAGLIEVRGNAGDDVGSAYLGEKLGMRGGQIVIHGAAGDTLGSAMRRGLIVVVGDCGRLAGYRMRAGTLVVFGQCGAAPGVEMLRGTLGLFAAQRPTLPPTFRRACRLAPTVAGLLREHLKDLVGIDISSQTPREVQLFSGDLLCGGRGEILTR